ncbi:MAG: amidohydrolase family protein, partial [Acidobacteriota bacterium]
FLFHWIIRRAAEVELPLQIHTGYLSGNGSVLENSRPADLNNIFLQYPEVDFIIFHGGYPWTSQAVSLTKAFPNVSIDLVWLPQISKEAAVRALEEILDMVPYNKILWGGDCETIEETAGSLESGKEVVARVLAARVERGAMSEETARDVALKIFRENAVRLFKLEERLGRPF